MTARCDCIVQEIRKGKNGLKKTHVRREWVFVTPEMARKWYENMPKNYKPPPLSESDVQKGEMAWSWFYDDAMTPEMRRAFDILEERDRETLRRYLLAVLTGHDAHTEIPATDYTGIRFVRDWAESVAPGILILATKFASEVDRRFYEHETGLPAPR